MVFISENLNFRLYVGRNLPFCKNLNLLLAENLKQNFDFLITPLFESPSPFLLKNCHADNIFDLNHWRYIILQTNFFELQMDFVGIEGGFFKKTLKKEINYGIYLGVFAIVIPFPAEKHLNYSKFINKYIEKAEPNTEIWLNIPINHKNCWEIYYSFKMNIKPTNCFGVLLDISGDLPDNFEKWLGENIKAVYFSKNIFIENKKGKPILTKPYQELFEKLIYNKIFFMIKGDNDEDLSEYRDFLCYLFHKQPKMTEMQKIEASYYDKLQIPLQPTKDNLQMYTYAAFEKDKKKYELYANAIKSLLKSKFKIEQTINIIMIGPGRGPIMLEIIKACNDLGYKHFTLKAIEKNPNSIITLNDFIEKNQEITQGKVEIIHGDIREYSCKEKADILVSELLGSFGDNELSPELICSAESLLKKDGFSIPCKYTSYLSPITCSHAYNKVCSLNDCKNPLEMIHLIAFKKFFLPSKIVPCFNFQHPFQENSKFKRFEILEFEFTNLCLIHGLIGFFDCILFEDIFLSICPLNKTNEMYSWFPVFFPFETPILVDENKTLKVYFWRKATKIKVWYEWQPEIICKKTKSRIFRWKTHNLNGTSHSIEK